MSRLSINGKPGSLVDHLPSRRRDGRDLGRHRHPAPGRVGDRGGAVSDHDAWWSSRALAPIKTLSEAMTQIESGIYDTRVTPGGPPELAAICNKLNHLAGTLGDAVDDKRRLAERVVSLQDIERKEIARELHDEFGPYLFALAGARQRADADSGCRANRTWTLAKARRRHPGAGQCLAAVQPAGA